MLQSLQTQCVWGVTTAPDCHPLSSSSLSLFHFSLSFFFSTLLVSPSTHLPVFVRLCFRCMPSVFVNVTILQKNPFHVVSDSSLCLLSLHLQLRRHEEKCHCCFWQHSVYLYHIYVLCCVHRRFICSHLSESSILKDSLLLNMQR